MSHVEENTKVILFGDNAHLHHSR